MTARRYGPGGAQSQAAAQTARIAELEAEVAKLKTSGGGADHPGVSTKKCPVHGCENLQDPRWYVYLADGDYEPFQSCDGCGDDTVVVVGLGRFRELETELANANQRAERRTDELLKSAAGAALLQAKLEGIAAHFDELVGIREEELPLVEGRPARTITQAKIEAFRECAAYVRSVSVARKPVAVWLIDVSSYGSFEYIATEAEAEEMRAHKASWEGGRGTKKLAREASPHELKAHAEGGPICVDHLATAKGTK